MSVSPLHVLIIGGGIGGLCLAQGLKAAGISVAVYERNPSHAWLEGFRIHINPVGSRSLHACLPPVLWEAFLAAAGTAPAGLGFLDEQLQELVVIAEKFMSNADTPDTTIEAHHPINRLALRHILLAGLEDIVHFEKVFERYEHGADGSITVFFADGSTASGTLLVAADGANSRVRQQYLPQAQRVTTGAAGIGGKLLLTEETRKWLSSPLLKRMNLIMLPDRYTLFNAPFDHPPMSPDALNSIQHHILAANLNPELLIDHSQSYILWALIAPYTMYPSNVLALKGHELQDIVHHMLAQAHPTLHRLIAESVPESIAFHPFKASTQIAPWPSSNVTLLGDAIHNMPPVGGMGGNMALYDASILCSTLIAVQQGRSSLLSAIQKYEDNMREHGYAALRASVRNEQQAISKRVIRTGYKAWFRACNVLPLFKQVFEENWTRPMRNL